MDELEGAQACGLLAVAFNAAPGVPCDVRVEAFADLTAVLAPRPAAS